MISFNKQDYTSAAEWLSKLRHDSFWLDYYKKMMSDILANGQIVQEQYAREARHLIGDGLAERFWTIRLHNVENTVSDLWEVDEITLPTLTTTAVGMLATEWIERQTADMKSRGRPIFDDDCNIVGREEWILDCWIAEDVGLDKLKAAEKAGLIVYDGPGRLRPADNVSVALVAYLCGRIFAGDYPELLPESKTKMIWKFGGQFKGASDIEDLFGGIALGNTRRNNKDGILPTGHGRVDKLFEK